MRNFVFSYLLSIGALFINPYFSNGVFYPIATVFKSSWGLYKIVNYEWMPTFSSPFMKTYEVKFLIFLILISGYLMLRNHKIYKEKFIFYFLLYLGFIFLISQASRFMTTGALAMCLLSLKYLSDNNIEYLTLFGLKIDTSYKVHLLLNTSLFLAIGYIMNFGYVSSAGPRKIGFGIDDNIFPVDAVSFVELNNIQGKIFNEYEWGSYLIWILNRSDSIFIHGHIDDPNLLVYEYLAVATNKDKIKQIIDKYNVNYFLLDRLKLSHPSAEVLLNQLGKFKVLFLNQNSILIGVE
jgi:hypothetical protein